MRSVNFDNPWLLLLAVPLLLAVIIPFIIAIILGGEVGEEISLFIDTGFDAWRSM